MKLPIYGGHFGVEQAERLLWRAGFGPRVGEAQALARLGVTGAVASLIAPGPERLAGPEPRDDKGRALSPADKWGHDHLWWLDKMVRTSRPLHERMALIWHGWLTSSNDAVGSQRLMLAQNALFRRHGLGSFATLFKLVTVDPAMLIYLSGIENERAAPNENYGREMLELFSLGAGSGYTEDDIRETARALTGWSADYRDGVGYVNFRFRPDRHDPAFKVIFGKAGKFDWNDVVRLALQHPAHPGHFVGRMWSQFIPVPPDSDTRSALEQLYVASSYDIKAVVGAILRHPTLFTGPRMPKSPVVYTAGLLRRLGRGISSEDWVYLSARAGQQLFYPPNVAGWDETRWYDTSTFMARWQIAGKALEPLALEPGKSKRKVAADPAAVVASALAFWRSPQLEPQTLAALTDFARRTVDAAAVNDDKLAAYPQMAVNGVRHMIAVSPELQTA